MNRRSRVLPLLLLCAAALFVLMPGSLAVAAPPTPANDSVTISEDGVANLNVLANDTDPEGDPLRGWMGWTPYFGTAVVASDGTAIYVPIREWSGVDTFTYVASDGSGYTVATVTVTVSGVDDPPVAVDDASESEQDKLIVRERVDQFGAAYEYDDMAGYSVAIDGDFAVVGAPDVAPGFLTEAGKVHIFKRSGGVWLRQAKLSESLGSPFGPVDRFGFSAAISSDTVAVGAPTSQPGGGSMTGSVYVYTRSGDTWTRQAELVASDPEASSWFGYSIALDGETLAVGAPYKNDEGDWSGAVYVFRRSGGSSWTQQAKITAESTAAWAWFGSSVALRGDTLLVGAPQENMVYVFDRSRGVWTQTAVLAGGDGSDWSFGTSVAFDGWTAVVGSPLDDTQAGTDAGSAWVFRRSGAEWQPAGRVYASDGSADDNFGASVAVSAGGLAVGAPYDDGAAGADQGSTHLFAAREGTWTARAAIAPVGAAAGDEFGTSIAMSRGRLIVGAPFVLDLKGVPNGAAYVFGGLMPDANLGGILNVPAPGVLANDSGGDASGLVASLVAGPSHGTLELAGDGSFTYLSDVGWAGTDSFTYRADDASSSSGPATVALAVTPRSASPSLTQEARFAAPVISMGDARYGGAVSIDSSVVAVGDSSTLFATVERWNGSGWSREATLAGEVNGYGHAVAISGDTLVVATTNYPDLRVYRRVGGVWSPEADLDMGLNFPAVALEGDVLVAGSRDSAGSGRAYVYRRTGTSWTREATLTPDVPGPYGIGGTIAISGPVVAVGTGFGPTFPASPAVCVFRYDGSSWQQEALLPGSSRDGCSVDLDGDTLAVGEPTALEERGSVSLYHYSAGSGWTSAGIAMASDGVPTIRWAPGSRLGRSVALDGGYLYAGADLDPSNGDGAGSLYMFAPSGATWSQLRKIASPAPTALDGWGLLYGAAFGRAVAASDGRVIVGADHEVTVPDSECPGAAYVYRVESPPVGTCLDCHDVAVSGGPSAKVDFAAAAVDREAACVKCHWEPGGSHPYHNIGWNCGSCHSGMGFLSPAAVPLVSTAYGWFNSALSAEADADTLHVIHSNPTWAGVTTKNGRQCGSCHAAAACTVCHATAGIDPTHWDHTWDASLGAYWPGTGPSVTLFGRGTNVGNEGERTLTRGITCSDATCHNPPAGAGASVLVEDSDPAVVYSGAGWARVNQSGYSGNSYTRSNAAGARAELVFEGEKVEFISGKHPYFGKVRVYLDGAQVSTVDLHGAAVLKQFVAYRSPTLASGTHTITVEVIREKNAAARDYYGVVDAFRVYPEVSLTTGACSACHAPDTFTGSSVDRRVGH